MHYNAFIILSVRQVQNLKTKSCSQPINKVTLFIICSTQVLFSEWINNFKMQMAPLNSQKLLMFLLLSYSLSCSLLVCYQSVVWSSLVLLMMFWIWSGEINFCSQQWHLSRYLWFILLTLVLQQLLYQNLWGLFLDLIWI